MNADLKPVRCRAVELDAVVRVDLDDRLILVVVREQTGVVAVGTLERQLVERRNVAVDRHGEVLGRGVHVQLYTSSRYQQRRTVGLRFLNLYSRPRRPKRRKTYSLMFFCI